jgi:hypothetical protein
MTDEIRIHGHFYPQKKAIDLQVDDIVVQTRRGNPVLIVDILEWDDDTISFQVADIYEDGGIGNNLRPEIFSKNKIVAYSCEMRGN